MPSPKTSIRAFLLSVVTVAMLAAQVPVGTGPDRPPAPTQAPAAAPAGAPSSQAPYLNPDLLEQRADVQMARKNYREASHLYLQAIAKEPKNAVLYNKAGISFHQQFQLGTAKKYYERSIKLNKKYAEAINNLGTVLYSQKKHRQAIGQYKKALELTPNSASIYSNLGTAYFARKKWEEAVTAYARALELDPEVFERKSTYGILLQERSVEDRARFHYFLAKTYAAVGRFDKAIDYLKKALEEGFRETAKINEDPAFAELVKTEAFVQLMANPPVPIAR